MLSCSVWKCVKTCNNTRYLFILQLYSFNIKAKWCNFRKWLCRQVLSSCVPVRSDTPNLFHDDVKEISRERQPWVWVATPHETLYKPLTPVCSTVIQSVVDMCAPSRYFYQSWIYKPKTLTESQRQWWVIVGHTDCVFKFSLLVLYQRFPQSLVKMVKFHMVFVFLLVNSDSLSWWPFWHFFT